MGDRGDLSSMCVSEMRSTMSTVNPNPIQGTMKWPGVHGRDIADALGAHTILHQEGELQPLSTCQLLLDW